MNRRKRLLVNSYEGVVDAELRKVVERCGGRISMKTRIADALEIAKSGLSDLEYDYALVAST